MMKMYYSKDFLATRRRYLFDKSLEEVINDYLFDDELEDNRNNDTFILYCFNNKNNEVEKFTISKSKEIISKETYTEEFNLNEYDRCILYPGCIYVNHDEGIASKDINKVILGDKDHISIINLNADGKTPENYEKDYATTSYKMSKFAKYRFIYIYNKKVERESFHLFDDDYNNIEVDFDYGILYDNIVIEPRTPITYDDKKCFISYSYGDADKDMTLKDIKEYEGDKGLSLTPIIYDETGYDYPYIPSRELVKMI